MLDYLSVSGLVTIVSQATNQGIHFVRVAKNFTAPNGVQGTHYFDLSVFEPKVIENLKKSAQVGDKLIVKDLLLSPSQNGQMYISISSITQYQVICKSSGTELVQRIRSNSNTANPPSYHPSYPQY